MGSVESLVLIIQLIHLRIHLVMTVGRTLRGPFPSMAVQFICIQMMKNQLKNLIQTNKSYSQIQMFATSKNIPRKRKKKINEICFK